MDGGDLVIKVVSKFVGRPSQAGLHLFSLAFADFSKPRVLQIGEQGQQDQQDGCENQNW